MAAKAPNQEGPQLPTFQLKNPYSKRSKHVKHYLKNHENEVQRFIRKQKRMVKSSSGRKPAAVKETLTNQKVQHSQSNLDEAGVDYDEQEMKEMGGIVNFQYPKDETSILLDIDSATKIDGCEAFVVPCQPQLRKVCMTLLQSDLMLGKIHAHRHDKADLFKDPTQLDLSTSEGFQFESFMESGDSSQEEWWIYPKNDEANKFFLSLILEAGGRAVVESACDLLKFDGIVYAGGFALFGATREWPDYHTDGSLTDRKLATVLVPLKLLDGAAPELFIVNNERQLVQYKYKENQAVVMPVKTAHQTARQEGAWDRHDDLRIMLLLVLGPSKMPRGRKKHEDIFKLMFPFYPSPGSVDRLSEEWKERFESDEAKKWIKTWPDDYKTLQLANYLKK